MRNKNRLIVHKRNYRFIAPAQILAPLKLRRKFGVFGIILNSRFELRQFASQVDEFRCDFILPPLLYRVFSFCFQSNYFIFDFLLCSFKLVQLIRKKILRLLACKNFRCLRICQTIKRRSDFFQSGYIRAQRFEFGAIIPQNLLHNERYKIFRYFQKTGQIDKCYFRLDHPEFRQMPSRLALFRAECRAKTINLTVAQSSAFEVELAGLRHKCRVAEIVNIKQTASFFANDARQNRRVNQRKTIIIKKLPDSVDERMTDFAYAPRRLRTQMQMPILLEKINAVLFRRNRIIDRFTKHFRIAYSQFISADAAVVFFDKAGNSER